MTIDDLAYLDPDTVNGLNLYAYCGNNPVMGYDPNGTFAITTAIIIGLIAGAVIGGTVGGVAAYNQASASGATGWSLVGQTVLGVLGRGIIGAAIGGLIGAAAPYIGGFLSSSFPILTPVMMDGAIGYTVVATVSGAQIVAGTAAVLGAGMLMFASDHRPKNNQTQNAQFKKAAEKAGFNPKNPDDMDILQEIHRYIRENNLDLGWKKLVELMQQWRF